MKFLSAVAFAVIVIHAIGCAPKVHSSTKPPELQSKKLTLQGGKRNKRKQPLQTGAEQIDLYLPLLEQKRVGLVVNHTSLIEDIHLLDTLLSIGVNVRKIFAPEHGFRGLADAGEHFDNTRDFKTGLPIISLYGRNKKPTPSQLSELDVVIFDIQDVGARFYTYISTMHYVMEACAPLGIPVLVLDRPNPNGHYVDGPILKSELHSYVGMHPVPVVHGMTVGEYAQMINGEFWLADSVQCQLTVIPCKGYDHQYLYELPVNPSPNLKDMMAIYLYPSLCLFEGTIVSVGRGTSKPFQIFGHPEFEGGNFQFTPVSRVGASAPLYKGQECKGYDLSGLDMQELVNTRKLSLHWLISFYQEFPNKDAFFNNYFNYLSGDKALQDQIIAQMGEQEIRESWKEELEAYKVIRKKYLLYKDFE